MRKRKLYKNREDCYKIEKTFNEKIDQFLNNIFLSYSNFKDEMIYKQRKLVEHLSVPIIPIKQFVSVLPLIGLIDSYRIKVIEEKVLTDIAASRIQTLVIDLSGIAKMDMDVIDYLEKILTEISMMGCDVILTGLRPELVKSMVHSGIRLEKNAKTKGTLQETLKMYL